MSVLGGTRHWAGPAVGAVAITCLMYFFTAGNNPIAGKAAVGVILVLVILFMPNGILGFVLKRTAGKRSVPPALAAQAAAATAAATAPATSDRKSTRLNSSQ